MRTADSAPNRANTQCIKMTKSYRVQLALKPSNTGNQTNSKQF